ncbi:HIT family protein [Paucibacter sp. APW11]|uniref:HIT family protein n=1 Tax=Roseateles aquae TaxID=3077235 RepID=A0ABU3PG52_9BURK|nr:HIT family protein [Paucibacter sp. APW11]MDT9001317.1 HIT family protein [Paucibacter sp. APW11]
MSQPPVQCPLCHETGGLLIVQTPKWRLIRAEDANFPAFYRLVWQAHVAEFSDLGVAERAACMAAVTVVEQTLRAALAPTKINLASLGNVVPHLHWHVIARFDWDSHFPNPVWGAPLRQLDGPAEQWLALPLSELDQRLREALRQHEASAR